MHQCEIQSYFFLNSTVQMRSTVIAHAVDYENYFCSVDLHVPKGF